METSTAFEAFWKAYQRRVGKLNSRYKEQFGSEL
jgi:hypothetical protein